MSMCLFVLCSGTEWASYNIGLFLCELCAQVHRSLGSHISKVKSLRLDKWDAEQIEVGSDDDDDILQKYKTTKMM